MIHNENNHSVGEVTSLSTSEVIQWLESIGFAKYQQNFVAADIFCLAIILDIESVDELQELGIPKFPAKTLMKHIVELKANGFTAPPEKSAVVGGVPEDCQAFNEASGCC